MTKRKWFFKRGNARLSWETLPEWVQWVAVDKSGRVFGYKRKPGIKHDMLWDSANDIDIDEIAHVGSFCPDWQSLIFERPKPKYLVFIDNAEELVDGIVLLQSLDCEVCGPCKPVQPSISIVCNCGRTIEMNEANETAHLSYRARCPDCGDTWEVTWSV